MHFVAVKFEVVLKDVQAAFPHFAEHPSHGFVDEVVGMVEQKVSDAQGVSIFVVADEHPVGDDGNTLLPKAGAQGQTVEDGAVWHAAVGEGMEQPVSENLWARHVDEIPVVGPMGMLQVEGGNFFSSGCHFRCVLASACGQCGLHFLDEQEQTAKACLVPGGEQKVMDFGQGDLQSGFLDHHAGLGTFQPDEAVAVAVFPCAGLEKAAEHLALAFVMHGEKGFREGLGSVWHGGGKGKGKVF